MAGSSEIGVKELRMPWLCTSLATALAATRPRVDRPDEKPLVWVGLVSVRPAVVATEFL